MQKAGAFKAASDSGMILVAPDTSPRDAQVDGEADSWDLGVGAGFYVDATDEKWKASYQMYTYVTRELPELVNANFGVVSTIAKYFFMKFVGYKKSFYFRS